MEEITFKLSKGKFSGKVIRAAKEDDPKRISYRYYSTDATVCVVRPDINDNTVFRGDIHGIGIAYLRIVADGLEDTETLAKITVEPDNDELKVVFDEEVRGIIPSANITGTTTGSVKTVGTPVQPAAPTPEDLEV